MYLLVWVELKKKKREKQVTERHEQYDVICWMLDTMKHRPESYTPKYLLVVASGEQEWDWGGFGRDVTKEILISLVLFYFCKKKNNKKNKYYKVLTFIICMVSTQVFVK